MSVLKGILFGICLAVFNFTASTPVYSENITFGIPSYCPYSCISKEGKAIGYQVDVVNEIAKNLHLNVEVKKYPWARVLNLLERGSIAGTMSIGELEFTQNYVATDIENLFIGCFMKKKYYSWDYEGSASLNAQRIGLIQGYGYPPSIQNYIDLYGQENPRFEFVTSENSYTLLMRMLKAGRIDLIFDDVGVLKWNAKILGFDDEFIETGCLKKESLMGYVALSKKWTGWEKLLEQLNSGYRQLEKSGRIDELKQKYGLK